MSLLGNFTFLLAAFVIFVPSAVARAAPVASLSTRNMSAEAVALRVLIVGDSITQGHEGDYTWRYRIWQWFQSQGVAADFVGPWKGTRPQDNYTAPQPPQLQGTTPPPDPPLTPTGGAITTGGYALDVDQNFDSDHYGAWGRAAAQDKNLINNIVTTYQPDLILVLLGFNDLGFAISSPAGLLDSMNTFVTQARAAKSNVKFALGNVPHRLALVGRDELPGNIDQYNQLLASAIPSWSTADSPIAPVLMRENYACETTGCPSGYDGLHPNVLGEYQIAQAFSSALVSNFSIGTSALSVPANVPARPTPVPSNFKAVTSGFGVTVTWDYTYGAIGYELESRTAGGSFGSPALQNPNRYDTQGATDGQTYEYQVRMVYGDARSDWTAIASAIAHPQTPKPPTSITTSPTTTGIDISWVSTDSSVTEWGIVFFDTGTSGAFLGEIGIPASASTAHLDSLNSGHRYIIQVVGYNSYGRGTAVGSRDVIVGKGTPPAPTNFQITSTDPTTIQLDWCGSADAVGYHFWHRRSDTAGTVLQTDESYTSHTTYGVAYLIPGVWNYEFCVSAFNGNLESGLSACLTAAHPVAVVGGPVGGSGCYSASSISSVDSNAEASVSASASVEDGDLDALPTSTSSTVLEGVPVATGASYA